MTSEPFFGTYSGKSKSTEPSIAPVDSYNYFETDALKSKTQVQPQQPPPPWAAWCDRNSKPVNRKRPRVMRKLTKWQKNGPMTKKDWKHFCAWAAFRARPRETHKNIKFKSKPFGPIFDLCTKIQNHEDRDKAPGFDAGVVRSEL